MEQGKDSAPRASASVYSPSGGKPRAGLVSRLLSRLVSRLHPWLMLGRGIRLLRASVQHEGFQRRWTSLMKTEKLTKRQLYSVNVIMTLSVGSSDEWVPVYPCCGLTDCCAKQERVWINTHAQCLRKLWIAVWRWTNTSMQEMKRKLSKEQTGIRKYKIKSLLETISFYGFSKLLHNRIKDQSHVHMHWVLQKII